MEPPPSSWPWPWGAVLVTCELLVRRRTGSSFAMAILLAASPFAIDFFIVDRRPDLLGIVLLVALGIALVRVRGAALLPWLVAFGVAFAALVLVHEDVILIQVPAATRSVASPMSSISSLVGSQSSIEHPEAPAAAKS